MQGRLFSTMVYPLLLFFLWVIDIPPFAVASYKYPSKYPKQQFTYNMQVLRSSLKTSLCLHYHLPLFMMAFSLSKECQCICYFSILIVVTFIIMFISQSLKYVEVLLHACFFSVPRVTPLHHRLDHQLFFILKLYLNNNKTKK